MKLRTCILSVLFCIGIAGCANTKNTEESSNPITAEEGIENNIDSESGTTETVIDETILDHLSVQSDMLIPQKKLSSYRAELKQFDCEKTAAVVWPTSTKDGIQKEVMDDNSAAMNYENGQLSVNRGTLIYRKDHQTSYLDTLLSYAEEKDILPEKDLEFMTKEEAQKEAEQFLSQLGVEENLDMPKIVAASKEDLEKIQDTMNKDADYSVVLNAKNIAKSEFENRKGVYYIVYPFRLNNLPVYGRDDPTVQMTGDDERALLAYPMEAIVMISDSGIEEVNLEGVLEQLEVESENQEIIQYEGIKDALKEKFGDVILTEDYKVIHIWMEYFPLIKADSFDQVEVVPVWCCDFEINGDAGVDYTLRFNAFTGEEIS